MPNNRLMAEQRAVSLKRKFGGNKTFQEEYKLFMDTILECGHAELVPREELLLQNGKRWYPIMGELLQGPSLTNSLIGVLLRFRLENVVILADVEKLYHQVKIPPEHCDFLRFLWWDEGDISQPLLEHRMTAVDTEAHAIHLYQELKSLCAVGGFNLTKWSSNSRAVLAHIPELEKAKGVKDLDLDLEDLPLDRALGVHWCAEEDIFKFHVFPKEQPCTRRGILSMTCNLTGLIPLFTMLLIPPSSLFLHCLSLLATFHLPGAHRYLSVPYRTIPPTSSESSFML
ncbi:hypothetical protein SRHO_G00260610 [Serrasalmus rhombeus]